MTVAPGNFGIESSVSVGVEEANVQRGQDATKTVAFNRIEFLGRAEAPGPYGVEFRIERDAL